MSTVGSKALPTLPINQDQSCHSQEAVLPPLTTHYPQWCRTGRLGSTKSPNPFYPERLPPEHQDPTKIKKVQDAVSSSKDGAHQDEGHTCHGVDPMQRVFQLEKNIQHIQEQHKVMLQSLQEELEQLKMRNRELQFQLMMGGQPPVTLLQTVPPSPEDEAGAQVLLSPRQYVNPLQVEFLENEIKELQSALHESRSRNVYLQDLLQEQKKKLEQNDTVLVRLSDTVLERKVKVKNVGAERMSKEVAAPPDMRTPTPPNNYGTKLEEAEKMLVQLRQENEEQKKEILKIKSNLNKTLGTRQQAGNSGSHGNHHSKGGPGPMVQHIEVQLLQQRFPPLRNQNFRQNKNMTEFPPVMAGGVFHGQGAEKLSQYQTPNHEAPSTQTLPALRHSSQVYPGGSKKGHSGNSTSWGRKYQRDRDLTRLSEHRDRDHSRLPENGDRRHKGRKGDK